MSNDSIWVLVGIAVLALTFAGGFVTGVWKATDIFTNPEFIKELVRRENRRREG